MSVNLSNNQQYIDPQNSFGAGNQQSEPMLVSIARNMNLPSSPDEFVKFAPHFAVGVGLSQLVSKFINSKTRLNPSMTTAAMTAAENFEKSGIGQIAAKIDSKVLPIIQRNSDKINSVKAKLQQYTPNWIKNLIEKVKIGVTPKNGLALGQYNGMTVMSADTLFKTLHKLPDSEIARLGLTDILGKVAAKQVGEKQAARVIAGILDRIPAEQLRNATTAAGKKLNLLNPLNTTKAFLATNAKTPVSKVAQKGIMNVSEAIGGGIIGGWFGIIMNSIFLASTIKRTWDAPWGEKLSTFMEGALVDFCGGYLMALLGTRLSYKLLGIKNADKTAHQLKRIKQLTEAINNKKASYSQLCQSLSELRRNNASAAIIQQAEYAKNLQALKINRAIDRLKQARGFQKAKGLKGFFVNLINRPLRWIGNFFSVGLENLPTKVSGPTFKNGKIKNFSALRVGLQKFKNCLKYLAGYPVRLILVMMIVTPPLTKLCAKISHTLFGKPTKSIYDEEPKAEEPQENNPYHIDMNTFSEYTKAMGMVKAAAEEQAKKANPNLPAQPTFPAEISSSMINRALSTQKNKMYRPNQTNISPATYVPSTIATIHDAPEISEPIALKIQQGDKIMQYAERELSTPKKVGAFEF